MLGRSKTETIEFRKQCKFWAGEADIRIQSKQCDEVQAESYCSIFTFAAEDVVKSWAVCSQQQVANQWLAAGLVTLGSGVAGGAEQQR